MARLPGFEPGFFHFRRVVPSPLGDRRIHLNWSPALESHQALHVSKTYRSLRSLQASKMVGYEGFAPTHSSENGFTARCHSLT